MSKSIILLSDGTGNGAAKRNKTNVWRLYDALDLHRDDQIAFYDDGVGSQEFLPLKILGGAFGWGLKRNVRELYKYLCRTYEDGDRIYLFGFSRGAFTVRMLAGMIDFCGLCPHEGTEQDLDRKARANYRAFRSRFNKRGLLTRWLRKLSGSDTPLPAVSRPGIEFIGVWDTVDAYGLPMDELAILWDRLIYPLYFPDRELSPLVKRACHAVSVDDERLTFHPVLWDEGCEAELAAAGKVSPGRIEQVWFSGVHSDVGGGYPKDPLALVALDWMISKVEASPTRPEGLHLIAARRQEFLQRSDWNGPQHDSRSGLGAYYRYKPRNIAQLCQDPVNGVRIDRPKIHRAVLERIRCGTIPYAPTGLPADYQVVTTRGSIPTFETPAEASERAQAMNAALDVIFWRRWLYGALVVLTLGLILSPLYLPWERDGLCVGKACVLDPPLQLAKALLPGVAGAWFDALLQNPAWLGGFLGAFGIAFWLKSLAHRTTAEHAVAAWARLKRQGSVPPWRVSLTARIRGGVNSPWRRLGKWLGAGGLMTLILALLLVALDRGIFHVRSTLGGLCSASRDGTTTTLSIDKPCFATGIRLSKGKRYRFEVSLPAGKWQDGSKHTHKGPEGFEDPWLALGKALRRHREEPWFKLMGRIGEDGAEAFAIGAGPTEYRARSDGELFLYVNEAVFGLLPGSYWAWPYSWRLGPNEGTAEVTVTELTQDEGCPCQPGGAEPPPVRR